MLSEKHDNTFLEVDQKLYFRANFLEGGGGVRQVGMKPGGGETPKPFLNAIITYTIY